MLKRIEDVMEEFAELDSAGHQMTAPDPRQDKNRLLAQAIVPPAGTQDHARLPRVVNHN